MSRTGAIVRTLALCSLFLIAATIFSGQARAETCLWTGNISGDWYTFGNWTCFPRPSTGDDLVFMDLGANKAMNNDIADLSVNSISFSESGGGYTLTGTGNLTISGSAAITSKATGTNANTLNLANPLKFGAATAVIDTSSGDNGILNLNGPIDLNGSTLSFVWDSSVPITNVNGVISGNGGLSVDGIGGDYGLFLYADNTFTGPVNVNSGYLVLKHANALGVSGSAPNGTTVHPGGTLAIAADIGNEHLTLEGGSGTSGNGILQSKGAFSWAGPVTLNNAATNNVNLITSSITFTGPVTGSGGFSCCNGLPGSLAFSNPGNTFSGPSDFNSAGGALRVLANGALSPNSAVTLGGYVGGVLDLQSFSATVASLAGSVLSKLTIAAGQTLTVTDSVALNDTSLDVTVPGSPAVGTVFTIIDKTSAGAVGGTFNGLAEGATVTVGTTSMKLSYVGGTGNDVTLTVDSGIYPLTVIKTGSGSGMVTANTGAISCDPVCTDNYAIGTKIELTAVPDAGSQFTGWLGPCTGTGICSFTINATTTVTATFASTTIGTPSLDIDLNGASDPLTDGLLVVRYLFGITGTALTAGATAGDAMRSDPADIASYLTDIAPLLDIDGNNHVDPLTDGVLIIRYLGGTRGADLIGNALGSGATRITAMAIEDQIATLVVP